MGAQKLNPNESSTLAMLRLLPRFSSVLFASTDRIIVRCRREKSSRASEGRESRPRHRRAWRLHGGDTGTNRSCGARYWGRRLRRRSRSYRETDPEVSVRRFGEKSLGQSAIESTSSADGGSNSRVLLRKRCALTTRSAILPARLSSPALASTGRENPGTFLRPSCQEVSIIWRHQGPDFHKCWCRPRRA